MTCGRDDSKGNTDDQGNHKGGNTELDRRPENLPKLVPNRLMGSQRPPKIECHCRLYEIGVLDRQRTIQSVSLADHLKLLGGCFVSGQGDGGITRNGFEQDENEREDANQGRDDKHQTTNHIAKHDRSSGLQ